MRERANLRRIDDYVQWDSRRNQFLVNYWRKEVLPFWMGFAQTELQAPNGVLTVIGGGGATPPVIFQQDYASVEGRDHNLGTPLEVRKLLFSSSTAAGAPDTATADFTVLMSNLGQKRQYMNRAVHIRTIAGTAQLPGVLREPLLFMSNERISTQFFKASAGNVNVQMLLAGSQYYPWSPEFMARRQDEAFLKDRLRKMVERRKYVYSYYLTTDTAVALGANATADFTMKIGDDAHFEGFAITAVSTGAFSFSLSEPKTQQTIMNGQATNVNGTGTAQFPWFFPEPYLVPAGYRLNLNITDLSGAGNTVHFTIQGRKIATPIGDIGDVLQKYQLTTPGDSPRQMIPRPLV